MMIGCSVASSGCCCLAAVEFIELQGPVNFVGVALIDLVDNQSVAKTGFTFLLGDRLVLLYPGTLSRRTWATLAIIG